MKKSINYNLNKPDYSDQYDLRHWNDNTDIIDNQMKSEETARIQADNNEATARATAIAEEASARATAVSNEASARATAVSNEASARATAVSNEATARANADTALGGRIDGIVNGNTTVNKARADDDGNLIKATYQKTSNRVNSWQSTPDDTHYPSEKLVKDSLDDKANKISNASNGAVPMMDSNGQLANWNTQLNSLVCSYNANFQNHNIIENSFSSTQYSTITMSANLSRRVRHGSSEDYFFYAVGMAGYKIEIFNDSNYTQASDAILMPTEMYIYESKFYFKGIFLKEKTHGQGQSNTVYVRITVYAFTEPTIYQSSED